MENMLAKLLPIIMKKLKMHTVRPPQRKKKMNQISRSGY